LEVSGFNNGTSSIGKNFSVGLFNLLNNPYRKIELPILGRFKKLPSIGSLWFDLLLQRRSKFYRKIEPENLPLNLIHRIKLNGDLNFCEDLWPIKN